MGSEISAIYKPIYSKPMFRPLIGCRVSAGFPSPAEDYIEGTLDLQKLLVKHPIATFYIRVRGDSMVGANIHPGNLLVVDRAGEVHSGQVIVARIGDELCVKRLLIVEGHIWLHSENPEYDPIRITKDMDFEVWGRVMHSVQSFS